MFKKISILLLLVTTGLASVCIHAQEIDDAEGTLEEIIVTAEYRPVSVLELPTSVTVFDQQAITRRGAVHLEQLLNLAPNVNLSSGASRGRFVLIRGIGERSQFVEPVNPSVGLIIDGMDFTGIGGAASTLDMQQVEILRGPQGTLFGANALAGLINMVSNGPADEMDGYASLTVGNYSRLTASAAVGGPISQNTGFRLAVQGNKNDGYIDNVFLNRSTNDIDEFTARGKFNWEVSDAFSLDFTLLYSDVDNGYDAFSLDNTRKTYSDEPGHDRLESTAAALGGTWQLNDSLSLEALLSHVDADTEYGYDEDWSNTGICDGTDCASDIWGFDWWYSSTDNYIRNNSNTSADLRLVSSNGADEAAWVAGVYYRDQDQSLLREYTYASGDFNSDYGTKNLAAYGQVDLPFAQSWTFVTGLRYESRDWDYDDNVEGDSRSSDDESFWGGKVALEYLTDSGTLLYGLISRGYKAGGYNSALASKIPDLEEEGIFIPPENLVFGSETMWNYELGLKGSFLDDTLTLSAALFYQDRSDMQVKQSIVIPMDPVSSACPCNFIDSLQNASGGTNKGLEIETNWQVTDSINLFGSLGWLDTEYKDYLSYSHADADPENGIPYDLSGRDQAHAPQTQYVLGAQFFFAQNWFAQIDIEGKSSAYASANHNEKLDGYTLLNMRLAYETERWSIAVWGRNLTDQDVQTRGFGGFGNDPRKLYETEAYYQLGEPRVYGLDLRYEFF
ncbi:MAG: TonB-dependent receptor [Xanthomonadales bacterium]|nr:TonB-dependent receptor [Xanthomonadales bacterium]